MANAWFETIAEAQRRAQKRLPKSVYGALIAGSEKGLSIRDNLDSFDQLGRTLRGFQCSDKCRFR
jgi:isopentenyl diphosphate isomerase/L-lactate dehydrogenase-like FMN-dependent dehydrogenase